MLINTSRVFVLKIYVLRESDQVKEEIVLIM